MFNQLAQAGCPLPSEARGYLLLRDAHLPSAAWDTIQTWVGNTYDFDTLVGALRRLERPVPGHGGKLLGNLSAFVGEENEEYSESAVNVKDFTGAGLNGDNGEWAEVPDSGEQYVHR